ncbi:MAG: ADP-ribosylglycohydrolase family protein [Lentisphaerae bacterium]|nr:ADP-ribosylglycohydrolase family protein [Lentisphaerota bacterium]
MASNFNVEHLYDKILGCWTGKNIGGTLGTPFEGTKEMPEIDFYTGELNGEPLANDDLDLQLIWLFAAEEKGIYQLTPRKLAEYWLNYEGAPMGEYRNCIANIVNGLYPPLSGSCNNSELRWSNGAWIRSEIWACIFPGSPDEAARCAYMDSCCDHEGEGIWAEVFTAALESAAFVESDLEKAVSLALARIAPDCRIAAAVRKALELFHSGIPLDDARNAIVELNKDTGFFQAPQNIGFVVLALLYGQGDFGKTVCYAVHCGDDTDCTAATAGAVLGIICGRKNLPEKWCAPIGERIITKCVSGFGMPTPKTLPELTQRTIAVAQRAAVENPGLPSITEAPDDLKDWVIPSESDMPSLIGRRSPFEIMLETPFCRVGADLTGGVEIAPGETKKIRFKLYWISRVMGNLKIELQLPESWSCDPGRYFQISGTCIGPQGGEIDVMLTAGEFPEDMIYIPVKFTLLDRRMPEMAFLALQRRGSVDDRLLVRNSDEYNRFVRKQGGTGKYPAAELDF